jgi:hypothetical protein
MPRAKWVDEGPVNVVVYGRVGRSVRKFQKSCGRIKSRKIRNGVEFKVTKPKVEFDVFLKATFLEAYTFDHPAFTHLRFPLHPNGKETFVSTGEWFGLVLNKNPTARLTA